MYIKRKKIKYHKHNIGFREVISFWKTSRSDILTAGPQVQKFESKLEKYLGVNHVIGTSSCTAAIHLALQASGIGAGDEVIVPNITFAATALAVNHSGATPVLVDVSLPTGLIDTDAFVQAINEKTKAVIVVHLYGLMCPVLKIKEICDKFGILFFEDSAHCLEGTHAGIRPGQVSDGAFFSFYPTKSITSGEGGAFATNNLVLAQKVKNLRTHGLTKTAADRNLEGFKFWDILEIGWKYNLNDLQAALLIPQFRKIDHNLKKREKLAKLYQKLLNYDNQSNIYTKENIHARHIFPILVDPIKRDGLISLFNNYKIGCSVHYLPLHKITAIKKISKIPGNLVNSDIIGSSTISLPIYPKLKKKDVKLICRTINEFR